MQIIPWRKLLLNFVKRFVVIVEKRTEIINEGKRCLIIDDSLLDKTGKTIEFAGKL